MSHLTIGAIEALRKGPPKTYKDASSAWWTDQYMLSLKRVYNHYQSGGTLLNRP